MYSLKLQFLNFYKLSVLLQLVFMFFFVFFCRHGDDMIVTPFAQVLQY